MTTAEKSRMITSLVQLRWNIWEQIGSGSFGTVWSASPKVLSVDDKNQIKYKNKFGKGLYKIYIVNKPSVIAIKEDAMNMQLIQMFRESETSNNTTPVSKQDRVWIFPIVFQSRYHSKYAIKSCLNSEATWTEIKVYKELGFSTHPNLLSVYAIIMEDTYTNFILELCPGGCLLDYILLNRSVQRGKLLNFISQIHKAALHLHGIHVMHGDIKLENVLLSADMKTVKLTDYGLSSFMCHDQKQTHMCGSGIYQAPEITVFRSFDGRKADVWALGICLFAIIRREFPFTQNVPVQCLLQKNYRNQILTDEQRKDFSNKEIRFLNRALAINYTERLDMIKFGEFVNSEEDKEASVELAQIRQRKWDIGPPVHRNV